jgi:pilus assembly protein Flp/PilA
MRNAGLNAMKRTLWNIRRLWRDRRGGVFVEYLLLLTLVGIGTIAGLATVRGALLNELLELAAAIAAITP